MSQNPQESENGIIWLCSYPKSGNTWLRMLLGNYLYAANDHPFTINTIQNVIRGDTSPLLYEAVCQKNGWDFQDAINAHDKQDAFLESYMRDSKGSVFLKSHNCFHLVKNQPYFSKSHTKGFICIVRDPRDVLCSFARHLGLGIEETLDGMMDEKKILASKIQKKQFISSWDKHVSSFIGIELPSMIIRYEDLLENTPQVLGSILKTMGGAVDPARLEFAIKNSAFSVLQNQEQQDGFGESSGKSETFFAQGKAGAWQDVLTPEQARAVEEAFGTTMKRFGYL